MVLAVMPYILICLIVSIYPSVVSSFPQSQIPGSSLTAIEQISSACLTCRMYSSSLYKICTLENRLPIEGQARIG